MKNKIGFIVDVLLAAYFIYYLFFWGVIPVFGCILVGLGLIVCLWSIYDNVRGSCQTTNEEINNGV